MRRSNSVMTTKMAEEEEEPLLVSPQQIPVDIVSPRQRVKSLYESEQVLGRHSPYRGTENETISISASNSCQNLAESDHIVSIFVVAFDTKAGNVIEWCMPEDTDLDGVEFKAMASGSHTLQKDFCYFRKGNLFGLSCFENMPVESDIERGARMKSVGILSTSYTLLYRHMQFLEKQVRNLLEQSWNSVLQNCANGGDSLDSHMLETPGKYGQLKAFWEDKKGTLPSSESVRSFPGSSPLPSPSSEVLPEMRITHPAGCFSQFIKFFGEQIFILWKFALLGKRILFFSPPPIGVVCYRVYCACGLAVHNMGRALGSRDLQPHFYVNVADIEALESEMSYVACTTEKIFETKTHLYDVYVDNQNVTTPSQAFKDLLKVSDADKDKLLKLNNHRSQEMFNREEYGQHGQGSMDEEEVFTEFFKEQNNRLFQTLIDVSASQDRQLTSDHMKSMGLDPTGDRAFLMELVETFGIDVMLMVDNPCCPR